MDDTSGEAVSKYEAKRRQRMEENQRMLESLNIPTIPRRSARSQLAKSALNLTPTRSKNRQQNLRAIADKQEKERQIVLQQEIERQAAQKLESDLNKLQLARKKELEAAKIAFEKQEQKLKRRQQQDLKAEKKRQKLEQVQKLKEQEIKRQRKLEATQRRMERQQELKKQQQEWQKQQELPPEIIAQRNADIQKFIQEELDKQARLAREKQQREQEWREEAKVQVQVPTTDVADGSKTTGATDQVAVSGLEAFMGEIEYELVL
ncbi:Reticulocyte binding-like protein 2b [Phytophthora palmivora]|uniref:Reticulocyte binding-like protein 2b n=1 Tax=Phytophthora palmivora TaxID=4796 RepID=A0A2P4XFK6_9STRA|nr:Reticulocyte binding-like protein 2b [Phytophthora palmivora]